MHQHLDAKLQACGATVWVEDEQGKKRASHTVSANLKGDGSQEYKIDNKAKSGKDIKVGAGCHAVEPVPSVIRPTLSYWEVHHAPRIKSNCQQYSTGEVCMHIIERQGLVQAFLRCRGLALEGCCVMRQSQVTHLADANSEPF